MTALEQILQWSRRSGSRRLLQLDKLTQMSAAGTYRRKGISLSDDRCVAVTER